MRDKVHFRRFHGHLKRARLNAHMQIATHNRDDVASEVLSARGGSLLDQKRNIRHMQSKA